MHRRTFLATLAALPVLAKDEAVTFLGRPYRLASYNEKPNPMWEFTANESINNWTTLLTLIDRADAKTRPDLDRLAEGIMTTYKNNGAKILMAKTMADSAGKPFNYMLAAFDQPAKKMYELNFVKMAMGPKNAFIAIYGVHVTDPKDYIAKSKAFLSENSAKIGQELEKAPLPALAALPRRVF